MPEITADQLAMKAKAIDSAEAKYGVISHRAVDARKDFGAECVCARDHIIACLREWERLNPSPYWTHMEDGGYFYYDSRNHLAALVLNRDGVWQSWVAGECIATDESLDAAKAAVEKAVRNG